MEQRSIGVQKGVVTPAVKDSERNCSDGSRNLSQRLCKAIQILAFIRGEVERGYCLGKMQREKGARFERIIASYFRDWGYKAFRTAQYEGKSGNCADVEGVPYIHIECKHCERMQLYDWMSQAVRDTEASKRDDLPVVIHKANNKDVLVTMRFCDWIHLYKEWEAGHGTR